MIEIKNYFLSNVHKSEYYSHKFSRLISNCILGEKWICDTDEAIELFKDLSEPYNKTNPMIDIPNDELFICLCFYLHNEGYYIEQFPKFLERPTNRWDFSYDMIRDAIIKKEGYNGGVAWSTRRAFVDDLLFIRSEQYHATEDVEKVLKNVSTRNEEFNKMSDDEKLEAICNSIEYLLKPRTGAKFDTLDYEDTLGFLNDDMVKDLRNKLELYRHATEEDLNNRKLMTESEKIFLINYGLFVIDYIYRKKHE